MNKDKSNANSTSSSPLNSPKISVLNPPELVIKAVKPFKSSNASELSFNVGEFFHVTSVDKGSPNYYEAHDPLKGSTGLVPRSYFEPLRRGGVNGALVTLFFYIRAFLWLSVLQ